MFTDSVGSSPKLPDNGVTSILHWFQLVQSIDQWLGRRSPVRRRGPLATVSTVSPKIIEKSINNEEIRCAIHEAIVYGTSCTSVGVLKPSDTESTIRARSYKLGKLEHGIVYTN